MENRNIVIYIALAVRLYSNLLLQKKMTMEGSLERQAQTCDCIQKELTRLLEHKLS